MRAMSDDTTPTIRPLEAWDLGPVTSLVRSLRAAHDLPADVGGTGMDRVANDPGSGAGAWVVEDGEGAVVGTAVVQPFEGDACELKRIYLAPEHHGQGWGRALLRHARGWARGEGYRFMVFDVPPGLDGAERLADGAGFEVADEHPTSGVTRWVLEF